MNPIPVLDHGFVRLVDTMGDDASIVQAARVSYGEGTRTPSDDRTLIRYLMRHRHTTPFEMVEFKFHVKMPIFIARQWQRHRMASINEVSARYTVVKDEFYSPASYDLRAQESNNKQGSGGKPVDAHNAAFNMNVDMNCAFDNYKRYIEVEGVCREQARIVLPQAAYTEFYWKIDLHNLLHFLRLRMDSHAQQEIREYANAIYELMRHSVPITIEAWMDYVLASVTLSNAEMSMLKRMQRLITDPNVVRPEGMSDGEFREFRVKLEAIYG